MISELELEKILNNAFCLKCEVRNCRQYSKQVNHDYCYVHKQIFEALENLNEKSTQKN